MSYAPTKSCPNCGVVIPAHLVSGAKVECVSCRTINDITEL